MEKQALRERIWNELEESGAARFPFPPRGRIPNFAGADDAAERLAELDAWAGADAIKSNPDSPQRPVRRRALEAGKVVYVAVPRLREEECFLRLDPAEIEDLGRATTIGGSSELGEQVGPGAVEPIDLIVSGSVAVDERGSRVGKGEGYSDLEFAILRELGPVDDGTTTVTTVHELQVVEEAIPTSAHDVPMDRVVTPGRTIRTDTREGRADARENGTDARENGTDAGRKPTGVDWDALSGERVAEIPVLQRLR